MTLTSYRLMRYIDDRASLEVAIMTGDPRKLRECNDYLAQAYSAAIAAGDDRLAESIERQWLKVARRINGDWTQPPADEASPTAA